MKNRPLLGGPLPVLVAEHGAPKSTFRWFAGRNVVGRCGLFWRVPEGYCFGPTDLGCLAALVPEFTRRSVTLFVGDGSSAHASGQTVAGVYQLWDPLGALGRGRETRRSHRLRLLDLVTGSGHASAYAVDDAPGFDELLGELDRLLPHRGLARDVPAPDAAV